MVAGRSDAHKARMEKIRGNLRRNNTRGMASTSSHSLLTHEEAREEVMSSGTLFGVSPTLQLLNEHRGVAASPADAAALTPTQAKLRRATAQNGPSLRLQREQHLSGTRTSMRAAELLWRACLPLAPPTCMTPPNTTWKLAELARTNDKESMATEHERACL